MAAPPHQPFIMRLHPSPPLAYRNRIRLTLAEIGGQLLSEVSRELATKDTPEALKKALLEEERKRTLPAPPGPDGARSGGLFRWLKRG